ncbi:MAG: DUF2459 domain-containing protein [Nitrospira sp.]|nr:DUF2459 domain-containing protein [Nitrospira sp.]
MEDGADSSPSLITPSGDPTSVPTMEAGAHIAPHHLGSVEQRRRPTCLVRTKNKAACVPIIIGILFLLLTTACTSPAEGLRPASSDSSIRTIFVSLDTWHAMIAFPADEPRRFPSTSHRYEEWGYAERAWYLEGRQGLGGIVHTLFWPSGGVVEIGYHDRVWADRTPQPPAERFTFFVNDEAYQRLKRHLRATISEETPLASFDQSVFYPAARPYHLFHTCHQYAALALREAGLPLSPFWAFSRTSLAWQLRRAARIQESGRCVWWLHEAGFRSCSLDSLEGQPTKP